MGGWLALAAVMVAIGGVAEAPGLFIVAAATVGYGSLTRVWSRYGMGRVEYDRSLGTTRAIAGDTVTLHGSGSGLRFQIVTSSGTVSPTIARPVPRLRSYSTLPIPYRLQTRVSEP